MLILAKGVENAMIVKFQIVITTKWRKTKMYISYYCVDCGGTYSFNELKKKIAATGIFYYICPDCDCDKFELYGKKAPMEKD